MLDIELHWADYLVRMKKPSHFVDAVLVIEIGGARGQDY